jgi:hypothetical protein
VVANVDDGGAPPKELRMGWLAKTWGSLPDSGGLYDQEASLLHRMTVLTNIHTALSRFRERKGADIHNMPHSERVIIGALRRGDYI